MPIKESFIPHTETTRSYEQTGSVPRDQLYDSLLLAPSPQEVILPQNTYTMRLDSHTFSSDLLMELSQTIDSTREARLQGARGRETESLSSLDSAIKLDRLDGKTIANMTVVYSRETKPGPDSLHIPTAVIVHEKLSAEEIRNLRQALPSGVLILDGETNALLDETGAAEREVGRKIHKLHLDLGGTAFRAYGTNSGNTFEDIMNFNGFRYNTLQNTVVRPSVFFDPDTGLYSPKTGSSLSFSSDTSNISTPSVPESDEVREYRAKDDMERVEVAAHEENDFRNRTKAADALFDAAKDLYDVPHLGDLDGEQLRKVERKVFSKLHPDRGFEDGGDQGAYKEAGVLMDKIRKNNESKTETSKEDS